METPIADLPPSYETARLVVRRYQVDDSPWYFNVGRRNREHLARFETDNPIRKLESEAEARTLLEGFGAAWQDGKAYFLGAFLKPSNEFVAQVYIGLVNPHLPEYALGYFGDVAYGGHGYVAEAVAVGLQICFEHLGAHRVRLECDDQNARSARVAERSGFKLEGHIRENQRQDDGTLSGTLHYGLLRRER